MTRKLKRKLKRAVKDERFWMQMGIALIALIAILVAASLLVPKEEPQPAVEVKKEEAPKPDAFAGMRLEGDAAIVYDLKTGETLYARNAEAQLPLASLTKLLTVYAAQSVLTDTEPVAITQSALAQEGESGFLPGETFRFQDLAHLALVASSNDASAAIAEAAQNKKGVSSRSLMASAASAASLTQTYAVNGTGLDEDLTHSGGYGSARDVALLAGALLAEAPHLARSTTDASVSATSIEGIPHTLPNTNQGVVSVPGVLLSKTGFTDLAGGNLAVVFDAGIDHPVAIVVLGSSREGRFTDVDRLMKATLAHFAGITP